MKSLAELQAIKDRMKEKVILREGTNQNMCTNHKLYLRLFSVCNGEF